MPYHYESALQDAVIAAIKKRFGEDVWLYKANDQCQVGIPDIIICLYGHFVAVELKLDNRGRTKSGKVPRELAGTTPMQRYNIKLINEACGSAFVGYQVSTVMEKLEKIYASLKMIP